MGKNEAPGSPQTRDKAPGRWVGRTLDKGIEYDRI